MGYFILSHPVVDPVTPIGHSTVQRHRHATPIDKVRFANSSSCTGNTAAGIHVSIEFMRREGVVDVVVSVGHVNLVAVGSVRQHERAVGRQWASWRRSERTPLHQNHEEREHLQLAELRARTAPASRPETQEPIDGRSVHPAAVRRQEPLGAERGRVAPDRRVPAGRVEVGEDDRAGGDRVPGDDCVGDGGVRQRQRRDAAVTQYLPDARLRVRHARAVRRHRRRRPADRAPDLVPNAHLPVTFYLLESF